MTTALLLQVGAWTCALPLGAVVETMRALPCKSLPGTPEYVLGVSLIRGLPTPVVDLRRLLGVDALAEASQLVLVRSGAGRAALAVDRVLGLRTLADDGGAGAPRGVLSELSEHHVQSLRRLDWELLVVLEAAELSPQGLTLAAERA